MQKVTKATAAPADDIDEIDRALAEIAQKAGGATAAEIQQTQASAGARLTPEAQAVKSLYAFEPKLLDSDAELRKMFGSKVVSAQPAAVPRSPYHARLANNPHHSTSIKRTASFLANPESGWYPPTGVLKLKRYEGPETETEPSADWWTFDHPVEYRASQLAFLEVLQQADGNRQVTRAALAHTRQELTFLPGLGCTTSFKTVRTTSTLTCSSRKCKLSKATSAPRPHTCRKRSTPCLNLCHRRFLRGRSVSRTAKLKIAHSSWGLRAKWRS